LAAKEAIKYEWVETKSSSGGYIKTLEIRNIIGFQLLYYETHAKMS
jgi:hypothetical protein